MLTQIEKFLNAARGELGTKETPLGSNNVKYNTWYYGKAVSGANYPWCSVFVVWCLFTAGLLDLAWGTLDAARKACAEGARNWKTLAQSKGRWVTSSYQPGDIVVFDYERDGVIDHVGIVESVNKDGSLVCIEGNASDSVARNVRATNIIAGAYRPAYADTPAAATMTTASTPAVPTQSGAVKVGSTVRLKAGAKTYTDGGLASYVYSRDHVVSQITGDRAVITYGGTVVAAVRLADLVFVK